MTSDLSMFSNAMHISVNRLLGYEGVEVINPEGGKEYAKEEAQRGDGKQVSHHPPMSAGHAENEQVAYEVTSKLQTKFLGNSLDVYPVKRTRVTLKKYGVVLDLVPPPTEGALAGDGGKMSACEHILHGEETCRKLLETPGAIYTKPLEGRVWKVLEMPRDVHTSLHYARSSVLTCLSAARALEETKSVTSGIRAWLRSGHSKGSMSSSNMEEISEQTRGRETEPTARGRGKKDKSCDAVSNMEARLAKMELAMADTREVQPVSHEEFVSFQGKVLSMLASMESRIEALATRMESRDQEEASRVEVLKPHGFSGKRDAKELDNFLWHMERYFEAIALTDEATKVRIATLYLTDTTTLWWRRSFADMEKDICTIETWEDFKREIKRQFYLKDVAYLARKNMRRLKHIDSIRDYVKEFSSLMLEIPNMIEKELLFNFMDNLQGWVEQELRCRGVQDLATAMVVVESLMDYKRGDSSKVESLEDSHATGGGDEVSKDHNAPRMGSGKTPNVREGRDCPKRKTLNAMIEEKEQEDEAHMGSMQLLGGLQFIPNPSTPKTSLLSGVQVKEAKGKRVEVAHTYIYKGTKGNVNLMGKRKQHSKHQKCRDLHPSEASREKEVKNILAERVTRRQGVPPVIEYLVRWKGLPMRQVSWEHADALRRKLLETPGAIYTKPLEGRVWKVLEMLRDVHTSLRYGERHERSLRLSREF
ncbi:Oxysterol-binding protein-related protein 3C [Vitis vinifera]|uniref:Oxysterol-binding protein-related protein 3C n=1 Tax=Vitis vinifera TaxID=29760 RepID=A0A438HY68_VITVI|nr:Oxysterol-binding protein-related protein 3C [Vitis vinifera]